MKVYDALKKRYKSRVLPVLGGLGLLAIAAVPASAGDGPDNLYGERFYDDLVNTKPTTEHASKPAEYAAEIKDASKHRKTPKRTLSINLTQNPLKDSESLSDCWYASNQILGEGNDYLGEKLGLDKNLLGRLGLAAGALWGSHVSSYYAHETAHDIDLERRGINPGIDIDLSDWGGFFAPRYRQKPIGFENYIKLDDDAIFRITVNGLNQDELNAKRGWEQSMLKGELSFCDSLSHLRSKLEDVVYILGVGLAEQRFDAIFSELPSRYMFADYHQKGIKTDPDIYTGLLQSRGINLTKKGYLIQALAADILSYPTWESLGSVFRYLTKGERTGKPFTLKLADGLEITPPLFSLYLTPLGSVCEASSMFNPGGKNPFKFSLGTDLDFIGKGKVDLLRIGGQLYGVDFPLGVKVSPFAHVNLQKSSLSPDGFSAGFEASVTLAKKIRLRGKAEMWSRDLIKSMVVEGKRSGFKLALGLEAGIWSD